MQLLDWLTPERVVAPARGETLEAILLGLLATLPGSAPPAPALREKCARDLAFGTRGEVVRLQDEVVAVVANQEGLKHPLAALAVSSAPFTVTAEGKETPGKARAALLLLVPGRTGAFRSRVVPELRRFLSREGVAPELLAAVTPDAVLALQGLAGLSFPEEPLVSEAIEAVRYRVYPETPVEELVDLMVRRSLHAVPVVGPGYEVLGIVTTGDALEHLLARARKGQGGGVVTARDLMTRAVLCVSEEQELREVAQLMVNRDVEQLPVVREGQLVGFISRDTVLAALFGGPVDGDPA